MQPLKIAVVIPKYGLLGGAEGFVADLTERVAARKEFDVHVFAHKWRAGKAPVTFHRVPVAAFPRWLGPVSFAWSAGRQIQAGGFDIIHTHERIFEADIFSFHGIPHLTWRKKVRQKAPGLFDLATAWLEKRCVTSPRLKKILPVSSQVADELAGLYDIPADRIQVSRPGVSLERFDALDRRRCRADIRGQHNIAENEVVALFVGMNFEVKNLDLVIQGLAGLAVESGEPAARLLVVGRGNQEKYTEQARRAGVADRVVFAGEQREVERYFLASDIFVMPSVYDTFGLVVLEAMAAALPVIISENVGAKDIVIPGTHGYILPADARPAHMTGAMKRLMAPEARRKTGKACRRQAERFSWDTLADHLAALYHEIGGR